MWDITDLRSLKSKLAGKHDDGKKLQIKTNTDNVVDNILKYKACISKV